MLVLLCCGFLAYFKKNKERKDRVGRVAQCFVSGDSKLLRFDLALLLSKPAAKLGANRKLC